MEKLAVGPRVNPHMVSLLYPIERNLRAVAAALEKPLGCAWPGLSLCLSCAACLPNKRSAYCQHNCLLACAFDRWAMPFSEAASVLNADAPARHSHALC